VPWDGELGDLYLHDLPSDPQPHSPDLSFPPPALRALSLCCSERTPVVLTLPTSRTLGGLLWGPSLTYTPVDSVCVWGLPCLPSEP
jgi:hypothetical protein